MLLGRNGNLYASVLARRLVIDSVCRVRKVRVGLKGHCIEFGVV